VILDSSAVIALVLREKGWEAIVESLETSENVGIGAPTFTETAIVLSARLGKDATPLLLTLFDNFGVTVVPFGGEHSREALDAWLRFGKGRHAAALNFGDCMSYAVARLAGSPLLCTGSDFAKTDINLAVDA
jgi:ribonuclease VapC